MQNGSVSIDATAAWLVDEKKELKCVLVRVKFETPFTYIPVIGIHPDTSGYPEPLSIGKYSADEVDRHGFVLRVCIGSHTELVQPIPVLWSAT